MVQYRRVVAAAQLPPGLGQQLAIDLPKQLGGVEDRVGPVQGGECRCCGLPHAGKAGLDRTGGAGQPVLAGQQLLQLPGSLAEARFACQGSDAGSQGLGAETAQPTPSCSSVRPQAG